MNQQTTAHEHSSIDVLIVGAGPTGLTAAIELARRGISFRLIEKYEQRSPFSKALALHARTLELLELSSAKLADTFVREGYTSPGANLGTGTDHSVTADFSSLDTHYPYLLIIPQARTEELLEVHLADLGHTIEHGVELKDLTPGTDEVIAHLQNTNGAMEELHARYVLGCDGAHSTVRHALNLPFPGKGYAWTAFLGDVKLDGEMTKKGLTQVSSNRGTALVFPFQDGYARVITLDTAYQNSSIHEQLTLDELQDSLNAILLAPVQLREPRWLTRWSAQLRQIPNYRVGRVFLAGDAAHVHSPAGGQGLNTGMQDAYNLAWKLALVLHEQAPERLLDTYHAERHPVGQQVLRSSDMLLRSALLPNDAMRTGRNLAIRALVPLPPLQRMISQNLSGLGVTYRQTDRRAQLFKLLPGPHPVQAGDRLPDLELKPAVLSRETKTSVNLYDLLRHTTYTLFIEVAPEYADRDQQSITRLLNSVAELAGETITPYIVFEQGSAAIVHQFDATTFIDFKQQFRHKLGTQHGSILLVRPDGYLALHVPELQQERFQAELRRWITPVQQKEDQLVSMQ
ncbi:MAG TPA: FAD-dependent monooxygenase [Ktedonobacteraceae bacterium]|jgi:2-polyprenyl-6-methoxyphenol hydroxylase-like FAD-dependent oxidoreductase|nr:FAD-dependent monooxygenase [Ktedonobacteraceae bacterium]